jgi:long-chain acyl-CoA synthetase
MAGEEAKPGSVGLPLPAYRLRLRDMASGGDLKAIDVRGKGMIDAYYRPWRTRAEITTDGWFETGDLGRFDADGYLYILGRSKEMISVGGMKFFPQEVEAVLESHPAIAQACVFAEPHSTTWIDCRGRRAGS